MSSSRKMPSMVELLALVCNPGTRKSVTRFEQPVHALGLVLSAQELRRAMRNEATLKSQRTAKRIL